MSQNMWTPLPQPQSYSRWGWLRLLLLGIALFVVMTIVMFVSGNPNLYPTVILVGNFLVPMVFITFLYDHQHLSALSPATIAQSFALGGVLGVLGASVLEPVLVPASANFVQNLTLSSALLVGLIEEGCKIVAVAIIARRMRHNAEIDGLLLGAAVGMGFAALRISMASLLISVIGIAVLAGLWRQALRRQTRDPGPDAPILRQGGQDTTRVPN